MRRFAKSGRAVFLQLCVTHVKVGKTNLGSCDPHFKNEIENIRSKGKYSIMNVSHTLTFSCVHTHSHACMFWMTTVYLSILGHCQKTGKFLLQGIFSKH